MRKSTKTAVGAISLGILGLSYQLGTTATATTGNFASPVEGSTPLSADSATPTPEASDPTVVSPGSAGSESVNTAPEPAASASASASTSATPKATPAPSASQSTTATAGVSKTGDSVESGFGPVQVKVTKVDGKITDITYVQAVATHGRAAAFPYLVQYAIQANGSNFGNLSGATYTTNAFKRSLESALAKF